MALHFPWLYHAIMCFSDYLAKVHPPWTPQKRSNFKKKNKVMAKREKATVIQSSAWTLTSRISIMFYLLNTPKSLRTIENITYWGKWANKTCAVCLSAGLPKNYWADVTGVTVTSLLSYCIYFHNVWIKTLNNELKLYGQKLFSTWSQMCITWSER